MQLLFTESKMCLQAVLVSTCRCELFCNSDFYRYAAVFGLDHVVQMQAELEASARTAQTHAGKAEALKEALAVAKDAATTASQAKVFVATAC